MNGTEIISYLANNAPTIMSAIGPIVGSIITAVFLRSNTATTEFEKVKSGKLATKYGAIPVTGSEGMNQYTFNELAHKQGMRLPRYAEWLAGAFGSPQGEDGSNNYGWTKTSNTARTYTGCSVKTADGTYDALNGVKPYAISAYNLHDCAGNVSEWTDDYSIRQDSTSWNWQDVLGAGMGQAFLPFADGLVALHCGSSWVNGVHCGPRTVSVSNYPWNVDTHFGGRLACDRANA